MRAFVIFLAAAGCSSRALDVPDPVLAWESTPCVFRFPSDVDTTVDFFDEGSVPMRWVLANSEEVAGIRRRVWAIAVGAPRPTSSVPRARLT